MHAISARAEALAAWLMGLYVYLECMIYGRTMALFAMQMKQPK